MIWERCGGTIYYVSEERHLFWAYVLLASLWPYLLLFGICYRGKRRPFALHEVIRVCGDIASVILKLDIRLDNWSVSRCSRFFP